MFVFGGGKCPNFGGGKCPPGKWLTISQRSWRGPDCPLYPQPSRRPGHLCRPHWEFSRKKALKSHSKVKSQQYRTHTLFTYLIFVIFLTQAKFLENKIYTEIRVNYDKLHSKLPILRVKYNKLHSKLQIFRVKSVKIYTGQKKFTRAPLVVLVTNIRYGYLGYFWVLGREMEVGS